MKIPTPKNVFLRYQDKSGRGPFRPGVPALWADARGDSPPCVFERFPELVRLLPKIHRKGLHVGCACVGEIGLRTYFSASERLRLKSLGYRVHRVPANSVILADDVEAVFASGKPLAELPRARNIL